MANKDLHRSWWATFRAKTINGPGNAQMISQRSIMLRNCNPRMDLLTLWWTTRMNGNWVIEHRGQVCVLFWGKERSRCNPLCYNSRGHLGLYKIIPKLQPFILRCPSSSSSSWRAKIWANGRCCPWHFCPFGIWEILWTETLPNCTVLGYQNKLIRLLTNDIYIYYTNRMQCALLFMSANVRNDLGFGTSSLHCLGCRSRVTTTLR